MADVSLHDAKDALGSFAARLFLGSMALMVTVANLPLAENLQFDFGKAAAVAGAVSAWVASEWASLRTNPHPHDVKLRNKIFSRIQYELEFLRDHDFGGSFNIDDLKGIRYIAGVFDGVQYQFRDKKVEEKWSPLLGRIRSFSNFVALNSHMLTGSAKIASFKTDQDRETGIVSEATEATIQQANEQASSIHRDLEALEDLCLRRIGAFEPITEDQ